MILLLINMFCLPNCLFVDDWLKKRCARIFFKIIKFNINKMWKKVKKKKKVNKIFIYFSISSLYFWRLSTVLQNIKKYLDSKKNKILLKVEEFFTVNYKKVKR